MAKKREAESRLTDEQAKQLAAGLEPVPAPATSTSEAPTTLAVQLPAPVRTTVSRTANGEVILGHWGGVFGAEGKWVGYTPDQALSIAFQILGEAARAGEQGP